MAATGASPTYFNYDNFEEIQVSTAGNDIKARTGGMGLNIVVKRGTNQFRGSVRGYFDNESDGVVERARRAEGAGRHARDVRPQQADLGLRRRDRRTDHSRTRRGSMRPIRFRTCAWCGAPAQLIDRTQLKNPNVKVNWQATQEGQHQLPVSRRLQDQGRPQPRRQRHHLRRADRDVSPGQRLRGHRRSTGCGRLPTITRSGRSCSCPACTRYYNTGFILDPIGGLDQQAGRNFVTAQSYGSVNQSINIRPQHVANIDAQSFLTGFGRRARPEVRVRLSSRRGDQRHALAGQHDPRQRARRKPPGAGVPSGLRRQPRQLPELLCRRHDLPRIA